MRVLHVLNGAIGGASISTLDLIDGLSRNGVVSFIYCSSRVSDVAKAELRRRSAVPVHFGPMYFWNRRTRKPLPLRPLIEVYQLAFTAGLHRSSSAIAEVCRQLKIDVVHSSTVMSPDGAIAASRLGLGHVWHLREMVGPGQIHRLAGDARGAAARRLMRTGFLVANSESSFRSLVLGEPPESDAAVIHNGFDFSRLPANLPPPLSGAGISFGMVANLSSTWKRHELFIRAAALVVAEWPSARFRMYGEIPAENSSTEARSYFQRLLDLVAELGLQGNLEFMGYQADVGQIMAGVDIVVHPCESESFGRVFVETSATGRALIAVRGGAAAEIIQADRTGLLVPPNDVPALAVAMKQLLENPARARMLAAQAQQHVRQSYDLAGSCTRLEAVYEQAQRKAAQAPKRPFLPALWHTLH